MSCQKKPQFHYEQNISLNGRESKAFACETLAQWVDVIAESLLKSDV
jgi:hypothetical protein